MIGATTGVEESADPLCRRSSGPEHLPEPGKYPEFRGNVKAIDTRDLWREADVSPSNQGYHYNHNAETYYETGERLGKAMAELIRGDAK